MSHIFSSIPVNVRIKHCNQNAEKLKHTFAWTLVSNDSICFFFLTVGQDIGKRWMTTVSSEIQHCDHYSSHLTISLYLFRASWATYWMKAGSLSSSSPGTERRSGGEFRMLTSTLVSVTDAFCSSWIFGATWRVEEVIFYTNHRLD